MSSRRLSPLDLAVINLDQGLRTLFGRPEVTERPNPAQGVADSTLSDAERRHSAGLMRVNHTGEVCAQALYQGQALTARKSAVRKTMQRAAEEENDHLEWCDQRLKELDSHKSVLNPLWYAGSLAIGAAAGIAGDKWSLGFVVETERQVEKHLDHHLTELPKQDERSRVIIEQMKIDEVHHADTALRAGGAALPAPIKALMKLSSKIMTTTAYRI
ncbi:MAG: 2-polyprenyl-3-methyl-6-methoxy-1,4-benzoquinone monooxygenase [Gammaproteobacteria bacterium]|nr:2-polyprenyl-3-methyl-6-methoxy-1,4-benzoquinone monooxygenase [Gammaproteobacteria bacterium]